ncbi:MAG: DVUA0089 family protein [Bryobacterales bacterium]|nr:DVUA0089 family protein [Bryobacterales bacterium]
MFLRTVRSVLTPLVCLAALALSAPAAVFNFSGAFTSDGDVQFFNLSLAADGVIDVRTLSYGGWSSPFVSSGGFAPVLALYDQATGSLQQSDTVGGTAIGAGCSNGAVQDASTGFCEDATLGFNTTAGNYLLALAVQPNTPPAFLPDPFLLSPGQNFPGGPFADPGDPTGLTLRSGNWALQISLNGSADNGVPEPSTLYTGVLGLLAAIALRRARN